MYSDTLLLPQTLCYFFQVYWYWSLNGVRSNWPCWSFVNINLCGMSTFDTLINNLHIFYFKFYLSIFFLKIITLDIANDVLLGNVTYVFFSLEVKTISLIFFICCSHEFVNSTFAPLWWFFKIIFPNPPIVFNVPNPCY